MTARRDRDAFSPLITVRTALILLISVLIALGAGILLTIAGRNLAEVTLAGTGIFVAALKLLHDWITDQSQSSTEEDC